MARKMISTTVYLEPSQSEALRALSDLTGIPVAVYIRRGIDAVLEEARARGDLSPPVSPTWTAGAVS